MAITLLPVVVSASTLTGCVRSSAQIARDEATDSVRASAEEMRGRFEQAARGLSGDAQLQSAQTVLYNVDVPLIAEPTGDGVTVIGTLMADAESGGGLAYENFAAKLCLRYDIAPSTGRTTVDDVPCPPDPSSTAAADATVLLEED